MEFNFNFQDETGSYQVTQEDIDSYANMYGLNQIAPNRYSALFIANLMGLEWKSGIDPHQIVDEIKALEGLGPSLGTKPASMFHGQRLNGLWHKHFMPSHLNVAATNILNHLDNDRGRSLVEEILDPNKSPIVTKEMIEELSHRIVWDSLTQRAEQGKLTGEWIVYAKEQDGNYYIGIWTHNAGDEKIAETIETICVPQFPFLSKYFS
jgi:hypothetical protein